MLSENHDSINSSFNLNVVLMFISSSCLIFVSKTSNTVFNRTGKSVSLSCSEFWGRLLAFTTEYEISCEFIAKWPLLCWDKFSLHHFDEDFYHEWMLNSVKCFSCVYWDDHVIFILTLVNMVYHTIDLQMSNHPCILGIDHVLVLISSEKVNLEMRANKLITAHYVRKQTPFLFFCKTLISNILISLVWNYTV